MIDPEFVEKVADLIDGENPQTVNTALLLALGQIAHDNSLAGDMALSSIRATLTVARLSGKTLSPPKLHVPSSSEEEEAEERTVEHRAVQKFKQVQVTKRVADLREGDKVLKDDGTVDFTCLEHARRPGDGSYNVQAQFTPSGEIERVEWHEDQQNPEVNVLVVE